MVVHQPLAQGLFAAIGLQDQPLPAVQVCFAAFKNVADGLAAHAADADRGNVVLRVDRCQAIGMAHGDVPLKAVFTHGALSCVKGRQRHLTSHRCGNGAPTQQCYRQIGMVRADIGQARTGGHMCRHALQAHGQCMFVQLQFLFTTDPRQRGGGT